MTPQPPAPAEQVPPEQLPPPLLLDELLLEELLLDELLLEELLLEELLLGVMQPLVPATHGVTLVSKIGLVGGGVSDGPKLMPAPPKKVTSPVGSLAGRVTDGCEVTAWLGSQGMAAPEAISNPQQFGFVVVWSLGSEAVQQC